MSYSYKFETFRAKSGAFDKDLTAYLNERANENWRVKDCSYAHGTESKKIYASCMFERKS